MRRQLVVVFVGVSAMVALAFVVPLAFLVRSTAQDRAIDAARADAAAVVPVLVSGGAPSQLAVAVGVTESGRAGRMTVVTPDGSMTGAGSISSPRLEAALATGLSSIGPVAGGVEVVTAAADGTGALSAVRVFVPDDLLHRGQTRAWLALAGVAVTLVLLSVLVADRLARSIVQPTEHLAAAARRLGAGELDTRVVPEGPAELADLSAAFNSLGAQVSDMLVRERETVAELSHRLRTPLTKLRMRIESIEDHRLATELGGDVDDLTAVVTGVIHEVRDTLGSTTPITNAVATVAERAAFWAALAEDRGRVMAVHAAAGPFWVQVAAAELAAALDVVLDNVFTHTADDTPLDIGVSADEAEVRIWIGDSGPGFDPRSVEPGTSGAGSTGLGLDIPRRTAVAAGGRLEVGTSPFGGAEVTIVFPRVVHGDHSS